MRKQRKIKFRTWDNIKKKMHFTWNMHNGKGFGTLLFRLKPDMYSENFELMQFIGLKDKNRVDIYEKDIYKRYNYIYVVVWSDEHCGFRGKCIGRKNDFEDKYDKKNSGKLFHISSDEIIEIIGNIYKNPELFILSKKI